MLCSVNWKMVSVSFRFVCMQYTKYFVYSGAYYPGIPGYLQDCNAVAHSLDSDILYATIHLLARFQDLH